ncbi:unnamed protein product [Rotaria sp. Silwood2]|nr:unnamed protein product [Rotaria sp. Silwood2]CAF3285660.1 unnamed protein product [Rotaria sp. Silwood2]CAF3451714.1 unnamed protein product [Rotaria sp. Silwood2]CAF4438683.1 unnamed protein product [Rotaria sp. Silwood2]CAF4578841.1 unnamed protein product [Rotaria sp. Silwood2]
MNLFNPIMFVVNWKKVSSMSLPARLINIATEYIEIKYENEQTTTIHNESHQLILDVDQTTINIRLRISKLFGALSVHRVDLMKPLIH